MILGPAFSDITDKDRDDELAWDMEHAGRNSAGCYALAIEELRRKHEAGEAILSAEYGPQQSEAA